MLQLKLFNNCSRLGIFCNSKNKFLTFRKVCLGSRDICLYFENTCFLSTVPATLFKRRSVQRGLYLPYSSNMASRLKTNVEGSKEFFSISDYDCIGFDLDNTIGKYNISEIVKLEYKVLSEFLISEKGYNADYLSKPIEENLNFLQKGLILDVERGNVIKLGDDGKICKAAHGTKFLTSSEINDCYGHERKWDVTSQFYDDFLVTWNGPLSEKMRTLLDYFDMPASLIFARIIDSLDKQNGHKLKKYCVWPDILDGLMYMYRREAFEENTGKYFPALKSDPEKYYTKCSTDVINWCKTLRKNKITFLITGSNVDYASFTASNCLGSNWRDLFDIVICYARKPGFFTGNRPFLALDGIVETKALSADELKLGNMYSQGNWKDLYSLLSIATKKEHPKCVYVGDNLIQDVYTPAKHIPCDTVALVEEMGGEGMVGSEYLHCDSQLLAPNLWGSYFIGDDNRPSLWSNVINKYSKICIPDLEFLANQSLDFRLSTFVTNGIQNNTVGYYPGSPLSIARC